MEGNERTQRLSRSVQLIQLVQRWFVPQRRRRATPVGRDHRRKVIAGVDPNDAQVYQGQVRRVRIEPGAQAPGSFVNRLESQVQQD
jgi:hypothetical protein